MDELRVIARIHTDFTEKFGIPRQSNLVKGIKGQIIFEPAFRNTEIVRGLEGFDYIWLLWKFEGTNPQKWAATVAPPRLGGKVHMGVFATRSPYRPNPIGLSSVKLESIVYTKSGPVLNVSGPDLRNNTPIYDIKPYLAYTDSHPDAKEGFAGEVKEHCLEIDFPDSELSKFPDEKRSLAIEILKQDPTLRADNIEGHKYGVAFAGMDIHFTVEEGVLHVYEVVPYLGNVKQLRKKKNDGNT